MQSVPEPQNQQDVPQKPAQAGKITNRRSTHHPSTLFARAMSPIIK